MELPICKVEVTRVSNEQPAALPVHCCAHSLNLCLQDPGRKLVCLRDALEICRGMIDLICLSPKRLHLFSSNLQASSGGVTLKPLCPTKWTARTAAIKAILKGLSPHDGYLGGNPNNHSQWVRAEGRWFSAFSREIQHSLALDLPTLFLVQQNKYPWPSRKEIYPYRMCCLQLMQLRHTIINYGRRRNLTLSMMQQFKLLCNIKLDCQNYRDIDVTLHDLRMGVDLMNTHLQKHIIATLTLKLVISYQLS